MKPTIYWIFLTVMLVLLTSCQQTTEPTTATDENDQTPEMLPTTTEVAPSPTPSKTLIVTDQQDSGAGSLRQALLDVQPDGVIFFDTDVFPPSDPKTILLQSGLPPIKQGHVALDASDAGVILDGSQVGGSSIPGLDIESSHNVVRGFQLTGFSGPGILVRENADFNIIGGDRSIGSDIGQGNLIRSSAAGITVQGSNNTIQGNLIGTDITGQKKWGNVSAGIFVEENASRNVIGPDNLIAYNGTSGAGGGVQIQSENVYANRITRNNIHDNAQKSIFYNLWQNTGPLKNLQPPILLEFNLQQGFVSGLSCPNCTVEFFTADPTKGRIFEGSVVAQANGAFSFDKNGSFQSSQIRATAYSENQNNSEFSEPTDNPELSINLQAGNHSPRLSLQTRAFKDLPFNGIGITQNLDCTDEKTAANYPLAAVYMGYKWMRLNLDSYDWADVKQTGKYSDFKVNACQEKAVDLLSRNGIQTFYNIVYWEPQILSFDGTTRFQTDEEVQHYLKYVRFIVGHFKGKIQWYSILNEPNLSNQESAVRTADYINLVRQVVPIIQEIDPQAKIAIGELTSLNKTGALDYLRAILKSGILSNVDGIVWHGSAGNAPEYQTDFYRNYPKLINEIISTAQKYGFTGQFFTTELQWPTYNSSQPKTSRWIYTNPEAAKYYARSIVFHRSKNILVTVDSEGYSSIPQAVRGIRCLTNLLAGAQPIEIKIKFDKSSAELRSFAFRLPDGSQLIAFWRDVAARDDDDTSVANTIIFPDMKVESVMGIDPLYAYQQELMFSQTKSGLLISNFLIKDYPTFIHITVP